MSELLEKEESCAAQTSLTYKRKQRHSKILRFICEFCQMAFSQSKYLTEHKITHSEYTEGYPVQYYICNIGCSTSEPLTEEKQSHAGANPFKCDLCEKEFSRSDNLTTHKRIHTGAKPIICDLCERGFAHFSTLTKHKRIHTGAKPFKYNQIKKQNNQKVNLTNHKLKKT